MYTQGRQPVWIRGPRGCSPNPNPKRPVWIRGPRECSRSRCRGSRGPTGPVRYHILCSRGRCRGSRGPRGEPLYCVVLVALCCIALHCIALSNFKSHRITLHHISSHHIISCSVFLCAISLWLHKQQPAIQTKLGHTHQPLIIISCGVPGFISSKRW